MNIPRSGLLVLGTGSGCGKTVLLTGLAACLQQEGFKVSAGKPLHLISTRAPAAAELNFISSISRTPLTYPLYFSDDSGELSRQQWLQFIDNCQKGLMPTLLELPGGAATTLNTSLSKDSASLAAELGWPCILVGQVGLDCLEKMTLNCQYLLSAGCRLLGLAVVSNSPDAAMPAAHRWANVKLDLVLSQKCGVPFLGSVAYSPSIDVSTVNQGNLIKNISSSLDLLPVIKALNLPLCV